MYDTRKYDTKIGKRWQHIDIATGYRVVRLPPSDCGKARPPNNETRRAHVTAAKAPNCKIEPSHIEKH